MVLGNKLPTSVVTYILAVKYADKRRIETVARGVITQDVLNLDNMNDDERDHSEAW